MEDLEPEPTILFNQQCFQRWKWDSKPSPWNGVAHRVSLSTSNNLMWKLTCRLPHSFIFYVILDSGNIIHHNRKTNQGHLNTDFKLLILLYFLIINWLCNHCFTQRLRFLFWFLSTFNLKELNNITYGTYLFNYCFCFFASGLFILGWVGLVSTEDWM